MISGLGTSITPAWICHCIHVTDHGFFLYYRLRDDLICCYRRDMLFVYTCRSIKGVTFFPPLSFQSDNFFTVILELFPQYRASSEARFENKRFLHAKQTLYKNKEDDTLLAAHIFQSVRSVLMERFLSVLTRRLK